MQPEAESNHRGARLVVGGFLAILLAGLQGSAWAGPATQPADPHFSALISQLGDADFDIREAASAQLAAAGPSAKSALEQAADSPDPETRWRATALLKRLEIPPLPGIVASSPIIKISVRTDGAARIVDASVDGRAIHVQESPDGLQMTVQGAIDGRPATAQYTAASPADLKEQSPDAFDLYRQYGTGVFNGITINGGTLIEGKPVDQTDNIAKVALDVARELEKSKIDDNARARLLRQIEAVRQARDTTLANGGAAGEMAQRAYLSACDELRKQLAAAGLADPGAELPPPAASRLGVSVAAGLAGDNGVMIQAVQPASRGARLGLQPGDMIRAVNGIAVSDVRALRAAVTTHAHLVLSVGRAGQQITLREPEPTAAAQ